MNNKQLIGLCILLACVSINTAASQQAQAIASKAVAGRNLVNAIHAGNAHAISALLAQGAHTSDWDDFGRTALEIAVDYFNPDCIRELLKHDEYVRQINQPTNRLAGVTPLMYVAARAVDNGWGIRRPSKKEQDVVYMLVCRSILERPIDRAGEISPAQAAVLFRTGVTTTVGIYSCPAVGDFIERTIARVQAEQQKRKANAAQASSTCCIS